MNDTNVISVIYITLKNNVGLYTLTNFVKSDTYLQGVCTDDHRFKTLRLDRIIKEIKSGDNALALLESYQDYFMEHFPPTKRGAEKLQICFTGFSAALKKDLSQKATNNGMHVAKSVVQGLDFLCIYGDLSPGRILLNKKIVKARNQGSILLNENQYNDLLETGEIPEL